MGKLSQTIRRASGHSMLIKMILIGLLTLALLIPLAMIRGLVAERSATREGAESELVRTWGGEQTVAGPLIVVPFLERHRDDQGQLQETVRRAFFLPEDLQVTGTVEPERRRRGIYEVTLYALEARLQGTFRRPDFSAWRIPAGDILWQDAALILEITGMHGLRERVHLRWDEQTVEFTAARGEAGTASGAIRAPIRLDQGGGEQTHRFSMDLKLQGGRSLGFLPLGGETRVRLASTWPSPSFNGSFLPAERVLDSGGFTADWYVLSLGRSYPQAWRGGDIDSYPLTASRFGVDLLVPVDIYLKSLRSVKYGILFILLPFLVFLLFEVFTGLRVHPMQYLLVGFAACLFYLLLLSLSEHLSFDPAYLISALATVVLVTAYACSALRSRRRGLLMFPLLAAAYAFLYAALQSEDYALLIGSLGLFGILAAVMIITRRIDWYGLGRPETPAPAPPREYTAAG